MAKSLTIQESRWVGRTLRDKWRIDRRIARGGMGTVYAATHKNNGSVAAIKVLHPEFSRDPDTRSRFLQEGYAANQVNHAGVVRILDDDMTEEGLAFLVMELLEGELLEQRRIRKGGRLPLSEVYEIGDQLLDVLAAAHAKEIVHRDIKPDNIFLTKEGRLKVLDFGFAQMKSSFRSERTATGFLLGTPGFMAPEQAVGNRPLIDAQTDVWAVGATLFLLLTGEPVHYGESAAEMLIAAANYPARSVATLEPALPSALIACVDRALAFEKRDRWPDARSMQMGLRVIPGRPAPLGPTPDRARWGRSIPDDVPTQADIDDTTMMTEGLPKLDSQTDRQSEKTQAFVHPADSEEPTIGAAEVRTYAPALAPTERAGSAPEYADLAAGAEPTIIMDGRPGGFGAPARASMTDGLSATHPAMAPFAPAVSATIATPDEIPTYRTGRAHVLPPPRSLLSKALVLMLIGGITMIVVILTGLVVILGSD